MLFSGQYFILFLIYNPVAHQCVRIVRILCVSCEFMCIREMEVKELSF